MHENLSFKIREDLSINCDVIQSLTIEISSAKSKNIILSTICRTPNSDMKQCETYFKDIFSKNDKNLKNIVLAGDFKINFSDFETNKNVQDILNFMFRYNMTPLTNTPIRVTRHSVSPIDHIINNSVTDHNYFNPSIIKTDLSDHCPVVFIIKTNETTQRPFVKSTYKRVKKILTNLRILCTTEVGMALKKLKTPRKHIRNFSISSYRHL